MFQVLGIARGLQYLHGHDIVHGDIAAVCLLHNAAGCTETEKQQRNVLIDDQGNARLMGFHFSSIAGPPDFGISSDEWNSLRYVRNVNPENTETWRWRAPEIMTGSHEVVPQFTRATDIWSLAMVIYEVCIRHRVNSSLTCHRKSSSQEQCRTAISRMMPE